MRLNIQNLATLMILFILISSCTKKDNNGFISPNQKEDKGVNPKDFTSSENIITYFKGELGKEDIASAPKQMYREFVKREDIKETQKTIWNLWSDANIERLAAIKFTLNQFREKIPLTWDIPNGQKMKNNYVVKGEKPEKGYPLVINLHGGGAYNVDTPWGSQINTSAWADERYRSRYYEDSPSLYFIPRMSDDRIGSWSAMPQRNTWKRLYQLAVLSGLVDPNRVYLMGISQGGYGTLDVGLFMPDYFAGIAPMAAAKRPSKSVENIRNIAFRMEVGRNDTDFNRSIFAGMWKEKLASLKTESPDDFVHMVNLQNGGHDINPKEVPPWIEQFTRNANPKRVTYEYYNIGDGYPLAVYYLNFSQLKPNGGSIFFDIKRMENSYTIDTEETKGKVGGTLTLYIDDKVDLKKPILVTLNGKKVFDKKIKASRGVMSESIAVFGDPERIYIGKIEIDL